MYALACATYYDTGVYVAVGGSSSRLQEETKQEESRAGVNGLVNVSRMKAKEKEVE